MSAQWSQNRTRSLPDISSHAALHGDATSTRSSILTAAVQTLQRAGVEGFTLDAVARRAGVVKGLILYHYASRGGLLKTAAAQIAASRAAALDRALASAPRSEALDACWEELRRQTEDGTTRAWLSLCAAGLIDRSARNAEFEDAARESIMDGTAVALSTGVPLADFQCGFKAFRAPAAKVLFHLSQVNGFAFDVEILMLADQIGYQIAELPVRWNAVPGGHVRPTRDAPLMAADVLRTRLRGIFGSYA